MAGQAKGLTDRLSHLDAMSKAYDAAVRDTLMSLEAAELGVYRSQRQRIVRQQTDAKRKLHQIREDLERRRQNLLSSMKQCKAAESYCQKKQRKSKEAKQYQDTEQADDLHLMCRAYRQSDNSTQEGLLEY